MMQANPGRAIAAGFLATLVMTLLMYMAPLMGMPRMDVAGMLGSFFGIGWWMGMILHFIDGTIIFALIYAYLVYPIIPGSPAMRGTIWGVTLWFLSQIVVMPMMGNGVFSSGTPQPAMIVIGMLIGHLVYGSILGKLAGVQAHEPFGRGHAEPLESRR